MMMMIHTSECSQRQVHLRRVKKPRWGFFAACGGSTLVDCVQCYLRQRGVTHSLTCTPSWRRKHGDFIQCRIIDLSLWRRNFYVFIFTLRGGRNPVVLVVNPPWFGLWNVLLNVNISATVYVIQYFHVRHYPKNVYVLGQEKHFVSDISYGICCSCCPLSVWQEMLTNVLNKTIT